jgi:hypothetical protein
VTFAIVTACSRPDNLEAILSSIIAANPPKDLIWIVYWDLAVNPEVNSKKLVGHRDIQIFYTSYVAGSGWGHAARNKWLDLNVQGWIYFLDDDNLLHPDFFKVVLENIQRKVLLIGQQQFWTQERKPGRSVCSVDLAQLVFQRECVGDLKFNLHYEADGEFIERLTAVVPYKMIDTVASYYNRLRW